MILMVPQDRVLYPTLGPQVCAFIEQNLIFGPGDLRGQPAILDAEKTALVYRMYEVYPKGHARAGRRRFKRCAISLPKGLAKTELAAWLAAVELHPEGPVRCTGFTKDGEPIGGPVTDPYIPMVAYTEEQSEELAYGALKVILEEGPLKDDFDIGIERILRRKGDGKAVPLSNNPNARDGARTTFSVADEPLALDTPIPTPDGWTTMGALRAGDLVFGRDGLACMVVGVSDVHHDRPCYRVTLGDGTSIVADENHLWTVYDKSPSFKCERTVRTGDLFRFKWAGGKRFRIVRPAKLDTPDISLPIEPYVLGLWLGDGDERNATISSGSEDVEHVERLIIAASGYRTTRCAVKGGRAPLLYVTFVTSRIGRHGRSVVGELRGLGLLKNKHIPARYLRAGTAQRLALLQGLMDADGSITDEGSCTFVNSNSRLVDDVHELLRTLGYRPQSKTTRIDNRWTKECTIHKLHFKARPDEPPFRMERKAAKIKAADIIDRSMGVLSVERVESVPVRCIAVDNDDHLFLAGIGMTPTHNTHRFTLPRLKQAHQVMQANLPKRKIADPWMLEITTAPEPGAGSVAEGTMEYAEAVRAGQVADSSLFFFHRQAGDEHDMETADGFRAGVIEASGPAAEWRDIDAIVGLWSDPTTDRTYLERVYCNRLVKSGSQAFDVVKWRTLAKGDAIIPDKAVITLGFDGGQFHDSTGLIATHVESGYQWKVGLWERPVGLAKDAEWQVPGDEVDALMAETFARFTVWRLYADPPYWQSWIAKWRGQYGETKVIEWWTNRRRQMATALENFETAIKEGDISHDGDADVTRHIGNSRREDLGGWKDEQGRALWLIRKDRSDSPHKIDAAMASVLSWEARTDAIAAGVLDQPKPQYQMIVIGR